MILNQRRQHLLFQIMQSDQPKQIRELASEYKVSNRTIRYDLDHIDELLMENQLPVFNRSSKQGISFVGSQKEKDRLVKLFQNKNDYYYNLSSKERVPFIILEILQSKEYTTLDTIAEMLMVSRSTIIKDMTKVKKWVAQYNLKFEAVPNRGMRITGDERTIRRGLTHLLQKESFEMIETQRREVQFIEQEEFDQIQDCLDKIEEEYGISFSHDAHLLLDLQIGIAVKRIQIGNEIAISDEEMRMLQYEREFVIALQMAKMLEIQFKTNINLQEIGYITTCFLSGSIFETNRNDKENLIEIQVLLFEMITLVNEELGIDIFQEQELVDSLFNHLRAKIHRLKYDININNPLIEEIYSRYSYLFQIAKKSLVPVERYVGKKLSDDEIGFIALYIGAFLKKREREDQKKANVVVVCKSGVASSMLLTTELESIFQVQIVGTVESSKLVDKLQEEQIDLVVSTIPLDLKGIKWVQVNPLLREKDISLLQKYLSLRKGNININNMDTILKIIEKHCTVHNEKELIEELAKQLNIPKRRYHKDEQPSLGEILTKDTIELDVEVKDWEEAVIKCGWLLYKEGYIEYRYIESMVENVKILGPYIVMGKGIAIPHSRKQDGVKKVGISFIRLKRPVNFGNKENDPVDLVFALAATDHSSHLKALSQLSGILCDEEKVKKLRSGKEISEIIRLYAKATKS